ncbi:hypothetical protein HZC07_05785 [Candidatus Micrarchaeota archaeon]|nr:hypothetical protein [Candidatus Micrarchaeota archaeon]
MNKSWDVYTITPTQCTQLSSTGANSSARVNDCLSKNITGSSFYLSYSNSTESRSFSVVYQTKANITANTEYYKSCPIVSVLDGAYS